MPKLSSRCPSRSTAAWLALASTLVYCAASARAQEAASPAQAADYLLQDSLVQHPTATSHVRIFGLETGQGEHVVIIPSLGRGVEDFTEQYHSTITTRLVQAGFRVVLIQPRGIGKSTGDLTPQNASMSMFAQDIRQTLDALKIGRAHFVGHAFGNRLARTFATLYTDYVVRLALLASGGGTLDADQKRCLTGSFNLRLPDAERLQHIRCAFFASDHDPSIWLDGWYPELARAQMLAATMIDGEFYKAAGGKPFLLLQGAEDYIATPARAGRPLAAALGGQVTYQEIPDAGHALSSEQPELIAKLLIDYFRQDKGD